MTIQTEVSSVLYSGNDTTTVFPYTFKINYDTHLRVVLANAAGVETVQILNTDYTVDGVGEEAGGNVTMVVAPATGEKLAVSRAVPYTQLTDLETRTAYNAEVHEDTFDYLTMITQQLKDETARSVKVSETSGLDPEDYLDTIVQAVADAEAAEAGAQAAETGAQTAETGAQTAETGAVAAKDAAEAAAAGVNLPSIGSGDATKILKVNTGETGYELDVKIPTVQSGDATKLLKINSGEDGYAYGAKVPDIQAGDATKLLKINSGEDGYSFGAKMPNLVSGDPDKILKVNSGYNGYDLGSNINRYYFDKNEILDGNILVNKPLYEVHRYSTYKLVPLSSNTKIFGINGSGGGVFDYFILTGHIMAEESVSALDIASWSVHIIGHSGSFISSNTYSISTNPRAIFIGNVNLHTLVTFNINALGEDLIEIRANNTHTQAVLLTCELQVKVFRRVTP